MPIPPIVTETSLALALPMPPWRTLTFSAVTVVTPPWLTVTESASTWSAPPWTIETFSGLEPWADADRTSADAPVDGLGPDLVAPVTAAVALVAALAGVRGG